MSDLKVQGASLSMSEYLEKQKKDKEELDRNKVHELVKQLLDPTMNLKYKPEFIYDLLNHVGIKGLSYDSLAFQIGIRSIKTLYNWETKYPLWKQAKNLAQSGRVG